MTPLPFDPARLAPPKGARMLVVGGCGGIGRVLVQAALQAELRVAVADLPRSIEKHAPPKEALTMPVDATDEASVKKLFSELSREWRSELDVLVNLAGFTNELKPVERIPLAEFEEIVAGSLKSTFLVVREAIPMLRATGNGAIVHTASGLASHTRPGFGPYGAAKAGVIAMTKAIARENAPVIRANCIAPAAVDTEFLQGGTGRAPVSGHIDRDSYIKAIPMQRIGAPEDIIGPILFLAGPGARYMTGQVLYINCGGLTP